MNYPLLSVCLITYNHCKYIRQAIDSVLMQKVDFHWELIIADDFSTDGTREILLDYKKLYPEFIKLILQEKNVGPSKNWIDLLTFPNSKYIAYFEGDDYWTDPYKLQKQVDFLEANPEFSLCFHNALVIDEKYPGKEWLFNKPNQKRISSIEDVINDWFVSTASMVFRRSFLEIPDWLETVYNGDYALQIILANKGPFGYIDEVMSVYRRNLGGMNSKNDINWIYERIIELMERINVYYDFKYYKQIQEREITLKRQIKFNQFIDSHTFFRFFLTNKWIKFFLSYLIKYE